jgi:hypothetical protein
VNPQLENAVANSLAVAKVAAFGSPNPMEDSGFSAIVFQPREPPVELARSQYSSHATPVSIWIQWLRKPWLRRGKGRSIA